MVTKELLEKANKELEAIDIGKGKKYVTVNERIKAFRKYFPNLSLTTEIYNYTPGVVVMQSTITDEDGRVLATGTAYEKESSSNVNKLSYIENCETSACGRAIGNFGIGIDGSIASADEVVNAINNQAELAFDRDKERFKILCQGIGYKPHEILKKIGWESGATTKQQLIEALFLIGEGGIDD